MAEETKGEAVSCRRRSPGSRGGLRDLLDPAGRGAARCRCPTVRDRQALTLLGIPEGRTASSRATRSSASSTAPPPLTGTPGDSTSACSRRDPAHRDERRDHRRVAADYSMGSTTGARRLAAGAPEVQHAVDRDPRLRRHRVPHAAARTGGLPRPTVRVRRHVVVHDRPRGGHPTWRDPARSETRPYRGPGTLRIAGRELPGFAVFGGAATALSFVIVTALHPARRGGRGRSGWRSGIAVYAAVPAPPRARPRPRQ